MNWDMNAHWWEVGRTPDIGHGREGRDSPNPFSATTVQTLHYGGRVIERGKKGGERRRRGLQGGVRQRHATRLYQQCIVFNPLQKVRTTFSVELRAWLGELSSPYTVPPIDMISSYQPGGILILLFASGQASQKGSDRGTNCGRPTIRRIDWAARSGV